MSFDGRRKDAALQPRNVRIFNTSADHDLIALVHLKARMRQPIGDRAVVGHEQETRTIDVQSPHRIEPRMRRMLHQIDRQWAPLWIAVGADIALGLEEHDVNFALRRLNPSTIKLNVILGWVDPRWKTVDPVTVDGDTPLFHALLARPARANTRVSEHLLNARSPRVVLIGVGR
jgi:hypothetical protein